MPIQILLWVCLAIACSGALALVIYNFLSGRDLVRDMLDKRRLRSRSLSEWDEFWADNPRESDIVVCLTTTPTRIEWIRDVLCSLMAQTVRPRRIRLHLPDFSIRENCFYNLPSELKELLSLDIIHCEDYGPATKLIPALKDLHADQSILVVDDDMVYPPDMIEIMQANAEASPDSVCAMSGWRVPDDLIDRPTTLVGNVLQRPPVPLKCSRTREARRCDVFQGYSGYLVRPRFFDLEAVTDYHEAPPQAIWVDDVWLSAHCRVPKYVLPYRRYPCKYWRHHRVFSKSALGRLNRGDGNPLTRSNTIMIRHFPKRWLTSSQPAEDSTSP